MRALLLVILAACSPRLAVTGARPPRGTFYCFTASIDHRLGSRMVACANTRPLCLEALGTASRFGRMSRITKLGPCRRRSF